MSRSTTALKRFGVPGLAAVTLVAGLPLFLGTASAAHIGSLSLSPDASTDAAGVCVPYTVQLNFSTPAQAQVETVDVTLTEGAVTAPGTAANQDVDFCTLTTLGSDAPATPTDLTDSGAAGTSDHAEFVTNAAGKVTFGVTANLPGAANIQAFYETVDNDVFNAGEFQDNSTQTFGAGGPAGSNDNQDAATRVEVISATATATTNTDSDNAVEGESRTFRVFVGGANGRLNGVVVNASIDSSVNSADRGSFVFGSTNNDGIATGTITFPARTEASGTTSTDTVTFFVNQTGPLSTPSLDTGEPFDVSTVTVTDNAAQQNRTVAITPKAVTNVATDGDTVFTVTVDAATGQPSTAGTLLAFGVAGGSGDETATPNEAATADNAGTADTNDSSVNVTVNDPTPTVGQTLTLTATIRGTSAADTATLTFRNAPADARSVVLTPETVTVAPNTAQQLTATVRDVDGNPVQGVSVRFTETGAGAFRNGSSTTFAVTNAAGVATVETLSLPGETGTQTVTADISFAATGDTTQCSQAAGAGTDPQGISLTDARNPGTEPAGVCSDSSTVTYSNTPASPSATPTATTSPAPGCRTATLAQVNIQDTTIIATGAGRLSVKAPANSVIELEAYTRPSTTYRVVRRAEINAAGDDAQFLITPPANTRLRARVVGCAFGDSKVMNVRTALSLFAKRNGVRNYTFSGDSLPARPGGLIISLYRVTASGSQVLTSQVRANATNGEWTINRVFTGTGRFGFVVRTGQDLQNAPGSSNIRPTLIF